MTNDDALKLFDRLLAMTLLLLLIAAVVTLSRETKAQASRVLRWSASEQKLGGFKVIELKDDKTDTCYVVIEGTGGTAAYAVTPGRPCPE